MNGRFCRYLLLISAISISGCIATPDDRVRVERSDSAGVEIVYSVGPDIHLAWTFEEAFSMGGAEDGAASFYRVLPQNVAVNEEGRIFVLDPSAFRVVVFDSSGHVMRSFGHQGGGPGEFSGPTALAVDPQGRVAVFDFRKRGVEWFDSVGASLGFQPVTAPFRGGTIRFVDTGMILPVRETDRERNVSLFRLLHLGATDTTSLTAQEQPLGNPIVYTGCGDLRMTLPPLFTPQLEWEANGTTVVVVRGVDYALDVFHGTHLNRSLRRDIVPRTVTEAMALAELGDGESWTWSDGSCTVPPEIVVEQRGFASVLPSVTAVAVSPRNEVWAQRGAVSGEPVVTDVFSADGIYLGTLPEGSPWPVAFLPLDRLVTIERDQLDVERLVVYRVRQGSEANEIANGGK